jgi:Ulp1 family protease
MSLGSVLAETSFSPPIKTTTSDYADLMDWSPTYPINTVGHTYPYKPSLLPSGSYDNELSRTLSFHRRRKEELRQLGLRRGSVNEEEFAKKRKRLMQEGEEDEDARDLLVTDALKASLYLEQQSATTVDNADATIGQQLLEVSKVAAFSLICLPLYPAMIASSAVASFLEAARTKFWARPTRRDASAMVVPDEVGRVLHRHHKRKKRRHTRKKSQASDHILRIDTFPQIQSSSNKVLQNLQRTPDSDPLAKLRDPSIRVPMHSSGNSGHATTERMTQANIQARYFKDAVEDATTGKALEEVMKSAVGTNEISFSQEEEVINQMRACELGPGAVSPSVQEYSKRFKAKARKREEHMRKLKEEQDRKERERLEAEAAVREKELARARLLERPIPSEPVIKPLSPEWEAKVDALMRKGPGVAVGRTSTGVELTQSSFRTLLPNSGDLGWLNDEIINAYMQAVVDYGNGDGGTRRTGPPRYHAFNSFFYKKLSEGGPGPLARWSKRAKIEGDKLLQVELIFIPVHLGNHWTLLVVSGTKKSIEYFDSLNGSPARLLKNAKLWLQSELKEKWVEDEWKVPSTLGPCQRNGYDCGVFTVTTAKMLMLGINPLAYSQRDIQIQRRRMAAELHYGGFKDEFSPPGPPGGGGRWNN